MYELQTIMATSNNYGLNNDYVYSEYSFDSSQATVPAVSTAAIRDWPQFIFGRVLKDIAAVKVLEVEIPFAWYVFNTTNNFFSLIENGTSVSVGIPVTIPVGNYNATTLATTLAAILTAASAASGGSFVYTVTYNTTTGKFTFSNNDPGVSTNFWFSNSVSIMNRDLRDYLGFPQNVFIVSSTGPNPTLSSAGPASVTGPNYLFVESNTLGGTVELYLPVGVGSSGNLGPELAKVPINTQPGGVIFWQDPDPQKWFYVGGINNLDRIDIFLKLGSTYGGQTPLQLNGQSFSIKLGVLSWKRTTDQFVGGGANNSRVERRNA